MGRTPLDPEAAGEGWPALAPMPSIWVVVDTRGELESRVVGPHVGQELFAGWAAPPEKVQQRLRPLTRQRQLDLAMTSNLGRAPLLFSCSAQMQTLRSWDSISTLSLAMEAS